VWVANDTNAAGVIGVLDKNGLKVPVSGQDASVAGLQNVLLGKQTGTVYKQVSLEAKAASDLSIQLLKGTKPAANKTLYGKPFQAVTPVSVGPKEVEEVLVVIESAREDILCR